MTHSIRYQGAIIQDHQILLLTQIAHASGRSYWQIPGGRREPGETEEQCVQRELREETGLEVQIDSLLLDDLASTRPCPWRRPYAGKPKAKS